MASERKDVRANEETCARAKTSRATLVVHVPKEQNAAYEGDSEPISNTVPMFNRPAPGGGIVAVCWCGIRCARHAARAARKTRATIINVGRRRLRWKVPKRRGSSPEHNIYITVKDIQTVQANRNNRKARRACALCAAASPGAECAQQRWVAQPLFAACGRAP